MEPGNETRDPSILPRPDRRHKRAQLKEGDERAYAVVDLSHVEAWFAAHNMRIGRPLLEELSSKLRGQMRETDLLCEENPQRLLFYLGGRLERAVLDEIQARIETEIVLPSDGCNLHIEPVAMVLNATPRVGTDLLTQLHLAFNGELSRRKRTLRAGIKASSAKGSAA